MSALKDEVDAPQSPPTPLAEGGATSSKGQEAFITITVSGTGGPTVLEATFGTGSRGPKDSVRPSLSWSFELASPQFYSELQFLTASGSFKAKMWS